MSEKEYKHDICPECVRNNDSSRKILFQCKLCERWFCEKHLEPKLSFIRDFKSREKDRKWEALVRESIEREVGHPDLAYTREVITKLESRNEVLAPKMKALDESKMYKNETPSQKFETQQVVEPANSVGARNFEKGGERKMSETQRKIIGKTGLIALFIIIILIISSIWIYRSLQNQVNSLTAEKNQLNNLISILQPLADQVPSLQHNITDLLGQVNNLQAEKTALNDQVQTLQSQISTLQGQFDMLQDEKNRLESQIDSLNNQITALNTTINQQNEEINSMLLMLNDKFNVTGVDGIYVLNYTITYGQVGLSQTYTADITLYNALSTATVTVKLYGTDFKLFTYVIPTGEVLHRVETWTGDIWSRNYDHIFIESVTR